MKSLFLLGFCFAVAGSLSACAPLSSGNYDNLQIGADNSANNIAGGSTTDINGSVADQCGYSANITSADRYGDTLNTEYRACAGTNAGSVQIYPQDNNSRTICVFPVNVTDGMQAPFTTGTQTNSAQQFMYNCQTVQSTGTLFTFPSITFNGVYITTSSQAGNLSACISSGDLSDCAANFNVDYSYGTFQ